jgi:hypothetical protein
MSNTVDAPGQPEVRITAGSGSITVVAEPRDDVVTDGQGEVNRAHDGAFEVAPRRRSHSMTVRCPEGASVMVGTRSGSLVLTGPSVSLETEGGGPVEVETMSGSVTVVLPAGCKPEVRAKSLSSRPKIECEEGHDCKVAVRTMSGRITVRCR